MPNDHERLVELGEKEERIEVRLRAVEQGVGSIQTTQRLIGGAILVFIPIITAVLVRIIDRL